MAKTNINTKDSIEAIKQLVAEFKKLQSNSKNTAKTLTDLQGALSSLGGVSSKTNAQFSALQKQLKNSQKSQKSFVTQTRNLKQETKLLTAENQKLEAQLKKTQLQGKKTRGSFRGLLSSVKSIIGAFGVVAGIQIFANIVKNAFSLIKTFDSLQFTLERVSKGTYDVANNTAFLDGIVKDFGVNLIATTERYIKFLAAAKNSGLNMRDTESIFRSMTKASAVLGLKTDELRGVYLALEQMLSKGKVTTEELRRQLGERLPGAMGIMAASMGKTIEELDKMMKKGEVLSAKVLPDFAKAVEIAFGIENVEKVDTIVAAQNRMTSSWQNFIKVVGSSSGWLGNVFEWISDRFEDISVGMMDRSQLLQKNLSQLMKSSEKSLQLEAEWDVEDSMGAIGYYNKLREKILENRRLTEDAHGDEKKALEEQGAILVKELLDANKKAEDAKIKRAKIGIDAAEEEYLSTKLFVEKRQKLLEEAESIDTDTLDPKNQTRVLHNIEVLKQGGSFEDENGAITKFNNTLDGAFGKLARVKANYLTLRKAVEEPSKVPEMIPGGEGSGAKQLRLIKDLQAKIEVEKLQSAIRSNNLQLQSDETLFSEKRDLLLANNKHEIEIAKILTDDKINQDREKYKRELELLDKSHSEGKVSDENYYKQKAALKKEFDQKEELSELEKNKKIEASKRELSEDILSLAEEENQIKLDIIKQGYDKQIVELNKTYEEKVKIANKEKDISKRDKMLAEAWEKLEKGKRDVSIKMYNEIIDAQIIVLEAQKEIANQSKESIEEIQRAIDKLRASKKQLKPDDGEGNDLEEIKKQWQDWAATVRDALNAVGDVFSAFSDRKIEAINAEIVAEENRYDKLIDLAKGEETEKAALEKQREIRVANLEKKRLKEQQKQAKIQKAFAIAEIAINTAIAVSKVWGQTGIFGVAAQVPVIAMGFLQTAAVMAAPIPQYKEGLDNAKEDHVGMINDGGNKEYIERDGKILSTDTKNAIVQLKKGDTVYKDYDDMQKNSILFSALANGQKINQIGYENIGGIIEKSISKGFNKAKINNKVNVTNKMPNNYLLKKSRFNA